MLALASSGGAGLGGALNGGLAGAVEAELGEDDLGGIDGDLHRGAVGLLAGDLLDVDGPLLAVDLDNLALTTLVITTDDENLVVLANGEGADLEGEKVNERASGEKTGNFDEGTK